MQVQRINVKDNNLNNTRNIPSFQAKLVVTEEAKIILKKELSTLYSDFSYDPIIRKKIFGGKPFDFNKILNQYKEVLEQVTEKIDGNIEIVPGFFKDTLSIAYRDLQGNLFKDKRLNQDGRLMASDILPCGNEFHLKDRMKNTAKGTLAKIAFVIDKSYYVPTTENPFYKAYPELVNYYKAKR